MIENEISSKEPSAKEMVAKTFKQPKAAHLEVQMNGDTVIKDFNPFRLHFSMPNMSIQTLDIQYT